MTAEIVSLAGLNEEDKGYQDFLETLKENNESCVFLVEKDDGSISVGCNFEDRRDLVMAYYKLQNLIQQFINGNIGDDN